MVRLFIFSPWGVSQSPLIFIFMARYSRRGGSRSRSRRSGGRKRLPGMYSVKRGGTRL